MFCNVAVPPALLVPELCPGHGLADVGIEPRLGGMIARKPREEGSEGTIFNCCIMLSA